MMMSFPYILTSPSFVVKAGSLLFVVATFPAEYLLIKLTHIIRPAGVKSSKEGVKFKNPKPPPPPKKKNNKGSHH